MGLISRVSSRTYRKKMKNVILHFMFALVAAFACGQKAMLGMPASAHKSASPIQNAQNSISGDVAAVVHQQQPSNGEEMPGNNNAKSPKTCRVQNIQQACHECNQHEFQ